MEQIVQVQKTFDDGTAQVVRVRESACSGDCHKCSGCGSAQETMILTAQNPIGATAGDTVVIYSDSAPVLKAAVMLYILPVTLFLAGYLAGEWLWKRGILLSIAGILLGLFLVKLYDRHLTKKHKTVYTITGYAGKSLPKHSKKGDN